VHNQGVRGEQHLVVHTLAPVRRPFVHTACAPGSAP
jgi:hypothetical protein